ncbi:MAG TPA: NADH-quinone oxidoreductase subunit C [Steroidobacteraceae bacterium]|nr:NADH-quinone oxidoreductase subunit C [Steroidobacteraceae bacterium]
MNVEDLAREVAAVVGEHGQRVLALPDELCFEIQAPALLSVARALRDTRALRFEQLMDLAGVDYLEFREDQWRTNQATATGFSRARFEAEEPLDPLDEAGVAQPPLPAQGARFAVAYQLLSVSENHRLRLRVACAEEADPVVDSVTPIWPAANWFEREAFDLFGIFFRGHPDLRRILTDYGFVGHPFRKDFPLSGNVEVRYDPERKRVVYQPVSIEPRVLVPKVIREDNRYNPALRDAPVPKS